MDAALEEQRFIDQIAADPDDEALPLVYADWLSDHGHEDRAALLRAQVYPTGVEGPELQEWSQRREKLTAKCTKAFAAGLRKKMSFEWKRGLATATLGPNAGGLTAADARALGRFPYLVALTGFEYLTPAQLGHLSLCPNVKRLALHHYPPRPLTDADWRAVAELSHVERLCLVSDQDDPLAGALVHVARMTGLKELDLEGRPVGDLDAGALAPLTGLEVLNLARTEVGDEGLAFLPSLTRLRKLVLRQTAITDATLERLAPLQGLTSLDVGETRVQKPIAAVLRFPRLRTVGLESLDVGDKDLPALLSLPDLRELDLGRTKVTRFRLTFFLPQTKWKKVRLEYPCDAWSDAGDREVRAFQDFCREHDVVVDVDYE